MEEQIISTAVSESNKVMDQLVYIVDEITLLTLKEKEYESKGNHAMAIKMQEMKSTYLDTIKTILQIH